MSEPTVIITGAGGFIGGSLVERLCARGWRVRALVRRPPGHPLVGVDYFTYSLAKGPPEAAFKGAQFLVHCAFVRHGTAPGADLANLEGARALIAGCRKWDVKPLFVSSFSAREGTESHYGRMKRQLEAQFDPARDLILRPGLVIGTGGLFGSMDQFTARHRLVPLVGSGRQTLQVIAVDDLCQVIQRGLERGVCGTHWIAHPEPASLREILAALSARHGHRALFLPVPAGPLLMACRLAELLRIHLPVNSDSILGLRQAPPVDTAADMAVFGVQPKGLHACIAELTPTPGAGSPRDPSGR